MAFKFEKLEVWQLVLEYIDQIYEIANQLPRTEEYNPSTSSGRRLKSQIIRAATSVALNIAEGSTGQTDPEQARFLGHAIRSLIETVACQHLISRRGYLSESTLLREAYRQAETLARKLQAMPKAITPTQPWLREEPPVYGIDTQPPF